jgi:hypothetical protein
LTNAVTSYFKGRQPFLFYTSFLYTGKGALDQPLHRDVLTKRFPIITTLTDIEGGVATTRMIPKSWNDPEEIFDNTPNHTLVAQAREETYAGKKLIDNEEYVRREAVAATTEHNTVMFDTAMAHFGAGSRFRTVKLTMSFIPACCNEEERNAYTAHCKDFGVADHDANKAGTMFPLHPIKFFNK